MELHPGDFILHGSYGVGKILDPDGPKDSARAHSGSKFIIRFQNGETRTLTQELLERSSQKISAESFRAYAYLDEAAARELLISDPVAVIMMVLQDFPGFVAKNEDFKDYLSPYVANWAEWWETTQPKLKDSPQIDTSRSKVREYGLREDALSRAEELYRFFRSIRHQPGSGTYEKARRTLTENQNGSSLADEHLQDVLRYVKQFIQADTNDPGLRLDAIFRLQEGKWLEAEQVSEAISGVFASGVRLYQLDLFSLNRAVEFLISQPPNQEQEALLATAICSVETSIKEIIKWALLRGESDFIALLLKTALSKNIPPELDKEELKDFAFRLRSLQKLVRVLEIENESWTAIISDFQTLVSCISQVDNKLIPALYVPLLELSQTLYERLNAERPDLATNVLSSLLAPTLSKRFILGLVDAARASGQFTLIAEQLEHHLWSNGENRNFDFVREFIQSRGSTVEQVQAAMELASQYDSPTLRAHTGELVCDLIKKDDATDRLLFLPYLNQLHAWGSKWIWATTVAGLRESIYLDVLERSRGDLGDTPLKNAVLRFVLLRTGELEDTVEQRNEQIKQEKQRISQLEALLAEREQVIRELRSGYGGDTAEARFSERVRVVKEIASSLAEFERMEAKMESKSREVQAIMLRLESILAGINVIAMEPTGTQVTFSPQKHHVVDTTPIEPGEKVTVVERGYLIRDNKDKLRLLKPALVRK